MRVIVLSRQPRARQAPSSHHGRHDRGRRCRRHLLDLSACAVSVPIRFRVPRLDRFPFCDGFEEIHDAADDGLFGITGPVSNGIELQDAKHGVDFFTRRRRRDLSGYMLVNIDASFQCVDDGTHEVALLRCHEVVIVHGEDGSGTALPPTDHSVRTSVRLAIRLRHARALTPRMGCREMKGANYSATFARHANLAGSSARSKGQKMRKGKGPSFPRKVDRSMHQLCSFVESASSRQCTSMSQIIERHNRAAVQDPDSRADRERSDA